MKNVYKHSLINEGPSLQTWREKLNEVIFGSETRAGRNFDITMIFQRELTNAVINTVASFR